MIFDIVSTDSITGEHSTDELVVPTVVGKPLSEQFAEAFTKQDECDRPYVVKAWVEQRSCAELMNVAFVLREGNMTVAGIAWVTHHE